MRKKLKPVIAILTISFASLAGFLLGRLLPAADRNQDLNAQLATQADRNPDPVERPALQNELPAYQIDRSEVHEIYSPKLERTYNIYVRLPYGYHESDRLYPVVFLDDGPYSFKVASAITDRLGWLNRYEQMIVVGISYSLGDHTLLSRTRDYTPTNRVGGQVAKDNAHKAHEPYEKYSGGAARYRQFLAEELIPFVRERYRIDPQHEAHAGHSYAGLFGAYMLVTAPETFDYYIVMSSSLWYDDHVMMRLEAERAKSQKELNANAYFIVGEYEHEKLGDGITRDLVKDQQSFVKTLQTRGYSGLTVESHVVAGEGHYTIYPTALTRGLLWMSKLYRERAGEKPGSLVQK